MFNLFFKQKGSTVNFMSSGIQPLPVDVVHRIAAGEVIDSLAAAVRELIENALDAGATRIAIALWPEVRRIRVADNGSGMSLQDLQQAAAPHTTSKLHCSEDLEKVTSLGFRGEALHSLTQLAELEICTRPQGADQGWQAAYNAQGKSIELKTAAIAPGTVVTVSHLFATWPARCQSLPPLRQQMRLIQAIIQQSALCHPYVTWQVQQNDRPWFTIAAGKTAEAILPQVLPSAHAVDLQGLRIEVPNYQPAGAICPTDRLRQCQWPLQNRIELVLGLPDRCHRHRPDWIQVAVNGRCVKVSSDDTQAPELEQTILDTFRQTLPRNRYPICFIHLRVPPEHVDWNRHPAKAEIYLRHLNYWREQIAQAIQQAFQVSSWDDNPNQSEHVKKLLKVAEASGFYSLGRSIQTNSLLGTDTEEVGLSQLRAVAQIHQTYILVEHPAGLWLVEQHIAHERILYEQLCDRWQLVPLEPPAILKHLSPTQVEQLQRLGTEIEPFGNDLWAVRSAPELLVKREDCSEALQELSLGGDLRTAQAATACRSAIRNGTPLSLEEMQSLLEQWQRTRHPRTCPHGRPIYLSLEESDLARFFRRHWVIGKSHGI
jgi:DNA mismatch repair protein MutL